MRLFSDCFYHFLKLRSVVLDSGGMGETPCIIETISIIATIIVTIIATIIETIFETIIETIIETRRKISRDKRKSLLR